MLAGMGERIRAATAGFYGAQMTILLRIRVLQQGAPAAGARL
jgi:hypothetical protein